MLRRYRSDDLFHRILKESVLLQPFLDFLESYNRLITTFGNDCQIMKVLQQLLILFYWKNHCCLVPFRIYDVAFPGLGHLYSSLASQSTHGLACLGTEAELATTHAERTGDAEGK